MTTRSHHGVAGDGPTAPPDPPPHRLQGPPGDPTSVLLVVTNDFPPRVGGIEQLTHDLVQRRIDTHGAGSVVVHAPRCDGAAAYDATLACEVIRDPARTLLPTPALARRVERTLRRTGATEVLFASSMPLGLLARQLRGVGVTRISAMTHGHEVWWARVPLARHLLRRMAGDVDGLTYVSGYCRDRIAPALGRHADKLERLPIRVDRAVFRPDCGGAALRRDWGLTAGTPIVICVGRLIRRKGQDTLIALWPEVQRRHPGAVLVLVGDGPRRRALRRRAARQGVAEHVLFLGEVADRRELAACYDAADVFALPARSRRFGLEIEAFGIVYLEAAACGLPVVGAGTGGTREALSLAQALER